MLKSTHKSPAEALPLPQGWTAHKAPTGHTYYYNAGTKKSTYTRPFAPQETSQAPDLAPSLTQPTTQVDIPRVGFHDSDPSFAAGLGFQNAYQHAHIDGFHRHDTRRPEPKDRPKSKQAIPGASPWLLVRTKLGRRFIYNPDQNESFWKFPPEVLKCVVELDRKQRERRERRERGEPSESEPEAEPAKKVEEESDEYEEVEVTDDEDESNAAKRQRFAADQQAQGPLEFNEDDIAYQLAAMGQDDDYDDQDAEQPEWEGEEELSLEDAQALFYDLLDDYHINPFTPWDSIVEEGKIISDDRYLYLPNMRSRKEAWEAWSHNRIQKLKEEKARQEKKDPKIPYMLFLQKHATPKLYWPEFKRKFRKEAEMRDSKITDKDREKLYREHINRLKLPESNLKTDLTILLKSIPLRSLNRSTSLAALPPELLTDLRYISLRSSVRDPLVEAYIGMLPAAPDREDVSPEEEAEIAKQQQERERREKALKAREQRVEASKRQQDYALRASKGAMKAGEEEIRQAMQVRKDGLLGHLKDDEMEK